MCQGLNAGDFDLEFDGNGTLDRVFKSDGFLERKVEGQVDPSTAASSQADRRWPGMGAVL